MARPSASSHDGETDDRTRLLREVQRLRESEQRYRAFLANSSEAIWRCELGQPCPTDAAEAEQIEHFYRHGVLAECNDAMARMYGFEQASELVGMRLGDLLVRSDPRNTEFLQAFIRSGYRLGDAESHEVDRDGRPKFFLNTLAGVVENGLLYRAWGMQRDITSLKRTEAELRFLARTGEVLTDALDLDLLVWNLVHLILPILADQCLLYLAEDETLQAVAAADIEPSVEQRLRTILEQAGAARHPASALAARVLETGCSELLQAGHEEAALASVAHDAEHREMLRELGMRSALLVPLLARTRTLGVLVLLFCGSGRRYETADRELAEDLARRAALAIDNARLYGQLVEADRRKNDFLAMLAHELRNPLAPILSALEVMRLHGEGDAMQRWAIEVVERQSLNMTRLIDDLLDLSRITRGKAELRKTWVELATVVERAVSTSRPFADARNQQLSIVLPPQPVWLEADAGRLEQVLVNLLTNAVKFSDPGGHIWLSAECREAEALLRVRDLGAGIAPELLGRVFDLFVQGRVPGERGQSGLGIGLTLVRSLVEMHGGSVEAYSEGAGRGSEFVVRLPVAAGVHSPPPAPEPDASSAPAAAPTARTVRVLLVDDNEDAASSLARVLRMWGYEVQAVHDGVQAVEAARQFLPRVVLLDIGLPGMDGYEVARALRRLQGFDEALLVALTGYGQEEDQRRARDAGFDVHLTKPVDLRKLQRILAAQADPL